MEKTACVSQLPGLGDARLGFTVSASQDTICLLAPMARSSQRCRAVGTAALLGGTAVSQ